MSGAELQELSNNKYIFIESVDAIAAVDAACDEVQQQRVRVETDRIVSSKWMSSKYLRWRSGELEIFREGTIYSKNVETIYREKA